MSGWRISPRLGSPQDQRVIGRVWAWFDGTGQEGELKFVEEFNDYRGLGISVLEQR